MAGFTIKNQRQHCNAKAARDLFYNCLKFLVLQIHMQLKYSYSIIILLFGLAAVTAACDQKKKSNNPTPPQYDLNNPELMKLSDRLNEISGLAYYPKDSSIFCIVDEAGVLYKLFRGEEKMVVQHWKFSKSGDYEDIVLKDSVFYVIKSKGDIVAFRFNSPDSITANEYNIPLDGKNEFESMYYDDSLKKLVLLCKDCAADDKTRTSSWAFDPATKAFSEGPFVIDPAMVLSEQKTDEKRFKPSAAALHPLTGDLYILSSLNKVLVIADRMGKIKRVYPIDPKLYKQPEGIAFTPWGDMFISNEAAGEGLPNLLYYKYKNAGHEK